MEITQISFDQLPTYVYQLGRKLDELTNLLRLQSEQAQPTPDRWLSIEELSQYLPGRPAISTLYGKAQRREIPFSRNGKRLVFRQSEIDVWLQSGRVNTDAELRVISKQYSNNKSLTGRRKGDKAHV